MRTVPIKIELLTEVAFLGPLTLVCAAKKHTVICMPYHKIDLSIDSRVSVFMLALGLYAQDSIRESNRFLINLLKRPGRLATTKKLFQQAFEQVRTRQRLRLILIQRKLQC